MLDSDIELGGVDENGDSIIVYIDESMFFSEI
jgi:hypothetical protein